MDKGSVENGSHGLSGVRKIGVSGDAICDNARLAT